MPQIDEIDFLEDHNSLLGRYTIYVYKKESRALKSLTCRKIDKEIEKGGGLYRSAEYGLSTSLFRHDLFDFHIGPRYVLFDLSQETNTTQIYGDVEEALSIIGRGEETKSGLILLLPSRSWDAASGPVWYNQPWSSWAAAAKKATVILEPVVSVDTADSVVKRILAFQNLLDFSRLQNPDTFLKHFRQFVEDKSPNFLEFSRAVEYASLVAVDGKTGFFDANLLIQIKVDALESQAITASLGSFLNKPHLETFRKLMYSIDERVHRGERSASVLLRELYKGTKNYLISGKISDERVVYWAWLLLSHHSAVSSKAPVLACDELCRQYISFTAGKAGDLPNLSLNSVLEPMQKYRNADPNDVDARVELIFALLRWAQEQSKASVPRWSARLVHALVLARESNKGTTG